MKGNGMRLTEGSAGARILAFGGYQPARVLTNDELAATVETSDEWIRSRVGIASRRIAGPDETVADMAVAAGGKALAASGLSCQDIDLVIVATCTPEAQIPNTAATVARRLGIGAPGAYDMNAACAGFCYALANASDAVRTGSAANVLVIGAEKLSQWIDWTDRSTCIIFADGAGAAVVSAVAEPEEAGIGPVVWGSAGDMADKIYIPDRNGFIIQEGQAVFRWATSALHPVGRQACQRAGVDPTELAAFVPHQANLRIVPDAGARGDRLRCPRPAARIRRRHLLCRPGDQGTLTRPRGIRGQIGSDGNEGECATHGHDRPGNPDRPRRDRRRGGRRPSRPGHPG
jgi:3-oxoacyl-[acyl-carrier-protein] synthase III